MIYTFECKRCGKIVLCNSKEEKEEERKKHFIGTGSKKRHVPFMQTMHIEMRTNKKGNAYPVFVAN